MTDATQNHEDPLDPAARARELQLDALIGEALGHRPAADLEQRLMLRLQDARAAPTPARRGPRLLAAALLIGGTGIVAAVAWLEPRTPPGASAATDPQLQDPQSLTAADRQRIAQLLRDLELPARRDAAFAGLAAFGTKALPSIEAAIAAEKERGRTEILAALLQARAAAGTAAAKAAFGLPAAPVTLIADYSENCVLAATERGEVVFRLDSVFGAWDAELTLDGTLLVTEFSVSRVREIDRNGRTVWTFEDLKNPYDADRLPNGNTLIADTFGSRVIEVDPKGNIVWQYDKQIRPFDADRLPNGNTLIADMLQDRVIEVSPAGEIVWEVKGMNNVHDADRLPNGNTLITLRSKGAVIEVDREGRIVWEIGNLLSPSDADRLPDGHTLVAENGRVREFDPGGREVWRKEAGWTVEANRY